jgi:hypothetical protein
MKLNTKKSGFALSTVIIIIFGLLVVGGGVYYATQSSNESTDLDFGMESTIDAENMNEVQSGQGGLVTTTTTTVSSTTSTNTISGQLDGQVNGQSLTQAQAEILARQTWSNLFPEDGCVQECGAASVTLSQNSDGQYIVTGIFTQLDDSVSQTKKVSVATYQNGTWTLEQSIDTRLCHRGNSDGTTGWTSGTCI